MASKELFRLAILLETFMFYLFLESKLNLFVLQVPGKYEKLKMVRVGTITYYFVRLVFLIGQGALFMLSNLLMSERMWPCEAWPILESTLFSFSFSVIHCLFTQFTNIHELLNTKIIKY